MPTPARRALRRGVRRLVDVAPLCVFLVLFVVAPAAPAEADSVDATIDRVMDTESPALPGVSATVNGSGNGYYGDSLRATFVNTTDRTYRVAVPIGLRFAPQNDAVQTMLAAGNETIVVPPGASSVVFKAFCGEEHDAPPGAGDQFTPDGKVEGHTLESLKGANEAGRHDSAAQEDVWKAVETDATAEQDDGGGARTAATTGAITAAVTGAAAAGVARRGGGGTGSTRPLAGTAAIARLIETGHDTVEIDGETYVLPPDRLRPGVDGIAFETKQVDGHEVVDRNHVAIVPHTPGTPSTPPADEMDKVSLPPPEPTGTDPKAAPQKPGGPAVKLTAEEKQRIIEWGVKNNRTPEDIQQDLEAQNESAGGSGPVPVSAPPIRVTLGEGRGSAWYTGEEVTLSAEEAARHRKLSEEMKALEPQIKNLRRELTWARIESGKWMASQMSPESRWVAGMWDLIRQGNRIDNPARYLAKLHGAKDVEELMVTKYSKPRAGDFKLSGRDYDKAVAAWRNGPNGLEFAEHCGNIRSQAVRDIQSMTSPDPKGATSWFNLPKKNLDTMQRYQEQLIGGLKDLQARQKALTDLERSFADRIRTGPVRQ